MIGMCFAGSLWAFVLVNLSYKAKLEPHRESVIMLWSDEKAMLSEVVALPCSHPKLC